MKEKKQPPADPTRVLAVLWGPQSVAGRSGLRLKAIVSAAMELADEEGLEAVSMRKVAEKLGASAMSLYTYVPGKSELVELMVDTSYSGLYESVDSPREQGGWREGLRFIAERNWELYRRHPWLLHASTGRPVIGPHASLKYEAELRPLDGLGLSDVEMDAALALVLSHVEGCARAQALMDQTQRETGMTDAEWWVTQARALDRVVDPSLFPVATRVGVSAGQAYQAASSPEYALSFGLERILAGLSELIVEKGRRNEGGGG